MKYLGVAGFALAGILLLRAAGSADFGSSTEVKMVQLNHSGENGTATLEQVGSDLKVSVHIDHAPGDDLQPTHIHAGTCGKLNPSPEFPLASLDGGTSVTVLKNLKLSSLKGKYSINIHKSASDLATYVSCGEIK